MIIRKAVESDILKIANINIAAVPNGSRAKWGINLTAKFFESYFFEGGPFIVAEEEETLIGYVMGFYRGSTARAEFDRWRGIEPISINNENHFPLREYDCVLLSLAVSPDHTGCGVAKKLVFAFLEFIRFNGKVQNTCVETQTSNIAAQHVYQDCGYQEIARDNNSVWYELRFSGDRHNE